MERTIKMVEVKCPHCGSQDVVYFESKGYESYVEQPHIYVEEAVYQCENEECEETFTIYFELTPISITK